MIGQIICSALFQVLKFLLIWPVLDDLSQKAWGDQKSTSAVLSTFWCCRLFVCRRTIVCESLIRATIVELLMAKSIFFDIHLELPNNCPYCYYQVFFFFFLWLRLGPYWGRKWGCSPRGERCEAAAATFGKWSAAEKATHNATFTLLEANFSFKKQKSFNFHRHATFRYIYFENIILFKNA